LAPHDFLTEMSKI